MDRIIRGSFILKYQDWVNSPTTEACLIEFIGYRTPGKNEIVTQRYSQDIDKAFPISVLIGYRVQS